jgi:hypothetical protein
MKIVNSNYQESESPKKRFSLDRSKERKIKFESKKWNISDFEYLADLGKGTFGSIKLVRLLPHATSAHDNNK